MVQKPNSTHDAPKLPLWDAMGNQLGMRNGDSCWQSDPKHLSLLYALFHVLTTACSKLCPGALVMFWTQKKQFT